jgi:hypothetical protein
MAIFMAPVAQATTPFVALKKRPCAAVAAPLFLRRRTKMPLAVSGVEKK